MRKEATDKCILATLQMCLNRSEEGKHTFFEYSPHVRLMDVGVHAGTWNDDKHGKTASVYADDKGLNYDDLEENHKFYPEDMLWTDCLIDKLGKAGLEAEYIAWLKAEFDSILRNELTLEAE